MKKYFYCTLLCFLLLRCNQNNADKIKRYRGLGKQEIFRKNLLENIDRLDAIIGKQNLIKSDIKIIDTTSIENFYYADTNNLKFSYT